MARCGETRRIQVRKCDEQIVIIAAFPEICGVIGVGTTVTTASLGNQLCLFHPKSHCRKGISKEHGVAFNQFLSWTTSIRTVLVVVRLELGIGAGHITEPPHCLPSGFIGRKRFDHTQRVKVLQRDTPLNDPSGTANVHRRVANDHEPVEYARAARFHAVHSEQRSHKRLSTIETVRLFVTDRKASKRRCTLLIR